MWPSSAHLAILLPAFIAAWTASSASAAIPHRQVSVYFLGFSGNTNGSTFVGARYRHRAVEVSVISIPLGWVAQGAIRKSFNEDGNLVPYVSLGAELPQIALLPALGVELLFGSSNRYGIRLDHAMPIYLQRRFHLEPQVALGFSWHF